MQAGHIPLNVTLSQQYQKWHDWISESELIFLLFVTYQISLDINQ